MLKKFFITVLIVVILGLVVTKGIVMATDTEKYTYSSTINGVTVDWEYELNSENEIVNLVCKNKSDLSGSVTIPTTIDGKNVVSLGYEGFSGCKNITELILPDNLHEIGFATFNSCTGITEIKFPDTIETIGSGAFEKCTGLTELTFPNSLKDVHVNAFKECTGVKRIDFGSGINSIGSGAFYNCTSLTELKFPKSLYNGGGVFESSAVFGKCPNITIVEFENGMIKIPTSLCRGLTGITEVIIPNTVQELGAYAFADCTSLKKITILDNVTGIGTMDHVFDNHNEDLTICCYKDSFIAKYAIDNNIKYEYIARPTEDTEELIATVIYDTTKPSSVVLATIKVNKEVKKVEGWNLSEDKKTLTKLYTENATETIKLEALNGKKTEVEVKIGNIKKYNTNEVGENKIDEDGNIEGDKKESQESNAGDRREDSSITKESKLPQTGESLILIASIAVLAVVIINILRKLKNMKEIK